MALDLTTIAMDHFPLRWRLTDPKYRLVQLTHLEQIKPLSDESATRLFELTRPWLREPPFKKGGYFADVVSTSVRGDDPESIRRVRKWLYERGVPFKHRVLLSWDSTLAATTTWKMFVNYWDDFWYPQSDDLLVFDEFQAWALFLHHEEEAFFASRPMGT